MGVKVKQTWAQSANPDCIMQARFPRNNHVQRSCLTPSRDPAVTPGKISTLATPPAKVKYSHYFKSPAELDVSISLRITRTCIFLLLAKFFFFKSIQ